MPQIDRRTALASALAAGAGTIAIGQEDKPEPDMTRDEGYVMEAGMTREEAKAWRLIAEATAAFFALPELHPMDKQEVASAVHVIQNKLLTRPTYRKYIELAKAGAKEVEAKKKADQ